MNGLISKDYLAEQQNLHARDADYGSRGYNWSFLVAGIKIINQCRSVLDYGCGKGTLGLQLRQAGVPCTDYDPAVPQFRNRPPPSDLVICIDVLEHIEPDCVDAVVNDLCALTLKYLFVVICMREAGRNLSDGRNAHILIKDKNWWRSKFESRHIKVRRDWPSPENDKLWIALLKK